MNVDVDEIRPEKTLRVCFTLLKIANFDVFTCASIFLFMSIISTTLPKVRGRVFNGKKKLINYVIVFVALPPF